MHHLQAAHGRKDTVPRLLPGVWCAALCAWHLQQATGSCAVSVSGWVWSPCAWGPCPRSPARRCCVPRLLGFTMPSPSCELGTKVTAVVPKSAGSLPMPHHGARAGSVGCSQHISCPGVGVVSAGVPPAVCAPCWAAHGDGRACCAQRPPAAHHLLPQALQATAGHVR